MIGPKVNKEKKKRSRMTSSPSWGVNERSNPFRYELVLARVLIYAHVREHRDASRLRMHAHVRARGATDQSLACISRSEHPTLFLSSLNPLPLLYVCHTTREAP